jgi:psiF repeat
MTPKHACTAAFIGGSAFRGEVALLFNPRCFAMMTISSRAAATAVASLLLISSAFAQTAAPATPAPATKAAPAEKKAEKPRTAASLECSKEADGKSLHGKERKKFMSECKKTAANKAK